MHDLVAPGQRFNRNHPCPVCGGSEQDAPGQGRRCWGFLSEDGQWAQCMRENYAGRLHPNPKTGAYAHKLVGDCACGKGHTFPGRPDLSEPPTPRTYPKNPSEEGYISWGKVATYTYRTDDGTVFALKDRLEGKDAQGNRHKRFIWRQPNGQKGLNGEKNIPIYRIEKLVAHNTNDLYIVFIVEGEKSVHELEKHGALAVCSPWGSNRWDTNPQYFAKRRVAIIPDNDEKGQHHAHQIAESLMGLPSQLKILNLPVVNETDDVVDFFNGGGQILTLQMMFSEVPEYVKGIDPSFSRYYENRKNYLAQKISAGV